MRQQSKNDSISKISVCIATFNGEIYIKEQIESILNQSKPVDEIIISDGGSTDDTIKIIKQINSKKIKILHFDAGLNNRIIQRVSLNFENAILHATGNFIFLADQDDKWLSNKVEVMISELHDHILVISDCFVVDSTLKIIHDSYFSFNNSGIGFIKNVYKNSFLGCCMCFRSDLLNKALPFPRTEISHDLWLGLIAETFASTKFIKKNLLLYRRHSFTVSTAGMKSSRSFFIKIYSRLVLLIIIFLRIKEHFIVSKW